MVYPGKRSTGCIRCRKRKVKCDEGRPGCERCKKYGRECPGYENNLIIRFENPMLRSTNTIHARTNQVPSPGESDSKPDEIQTPHATSAETASVSDVSVWSLEPDWETISIGYFLDQHPIKPKPGSLGHLEFLPDLYLQSSADSCLRPSLEAVAYLSLYYSSNSSPIQVKARKLYHRALLSLNSALQDPRNESLDEALAATMLLSLFEDIDGIRSGTGNSHISGMVSLIRLREARGPPHEPNKSLYGWAHTQILFHTVTDQYIHLKPGWIELCGLPEEDYLTQMSRVMQDMMQFCYVARDTCAEIDLPSRSPNHASPETSLLNILDEIVILQSKMDALAHSVPQTLKPRELHNGQDIRIYRSRWTACFWSMQNSCLILFYTHAASCCEKVLATDLSGEHSTRQKARAILEMAEGNARNLLSALYNNIPFALGEIDDQGSKKAVPEYKSGCGYLLIWPLSVLSRCVYSTLDQKMAADRALRVVGSSMGIRLADWAAKRLYPFALF